MRKLFSTYPGEWPGIGLLLLRVMVACSLIALGMSVVRTPDHALGEWGIATLVFAGGALLLAGLMTPVVALLVATGAIGVALSWIHLPHQDQIDSYLAIANLIITSIAIALLGPGAFSLDARMFGRREITIPSSRNISSS